MLSDPTLKIELLPTDIDDLCFPKPQVDAQREEKQSRHRIGTSSSDDSSYLFVVEIASRASNDAG